MLLLTVNALGELASIYPVEGSFFNYSVRFIDPAWGVSVPSLRVAEPSLMSASSPWDGTTP